MFDAAWNDILLDPIEPLCFVSVMTSILWIPFSTPFSNVISLPLPTSSPLRNHTVSKSLIVRGDDFGSVILRVKALFASIKDSNPFILTSTGKEVLLDIFISPLPLSAEQGKSITPSVFSPFDILIASAMPVSVFPSASMSFAVNL